MNSKLYFLLIFFILFAPLKPSLALTWPPMELGHPGPLPPTPFSVSHLLERTQTMVWDVIHEVRFDRLAYLNMLIPPLFDSHGAPPHPLILPNPLSFVEIYGGTNCLGFAQIFQTKLRDELGLEAAIVPAFLEGQSYFSHAVALLQGTDGFVLYDPTLLAMEPVVLTPVKPSFKILFATFTLEKQKNEHHITLTNYNRSKIIHYALTHLANPHALLNPQMLKRRDFPIMTYSAIGLPRANLTMNFYDNVLSMGRSYHDRQWAKSTHEFDSITSYKDVSSLITNEFAHYALDMDTHTLRQRVWQVLENRALIEDKLLH